MRLTTKVVISIAAVGLISWGSIVGHSEWSAYQQEREAHQLKDAIHNELVSALVTINESLYQRALTETHLRDSQRAITLNQ